MPFPAADLLAVAIRRNHQAAPDKKYEIHPKTMPVTRQPKQAERVPRNFGHIEAMRDIRTAISADSVHSKASEPPQRQTASLHRKMRLSIADSNEWPDPTKNGLRSWFHQDADATGPFHA